MSNAAVLLRGRHIELGDGLYLERSDPREGKFEEFLRALVSKCPRPNLVRARLKRFVAAHPNLVRHCMGIHAAVG